MESMRGQTSNDNISDSHTLEVQGSDTVELGGAESGKGACVAEVCSESALDHHILLSQVESTVKLGPRRPCQKSGEYALREGEG